MILAFKSEFFLGEKMLKDNNVLMAKNGDKEFVLLSKMANRHGLIAGATGSGKTITLKVMAESFSANGVPVFLSDARKNKKI